MATDKELLEEALKKLKQDAVDYEVNAAGIREMAERRHLDEMNALKISYEDIIKTKDKQIAELEKEIGSTGHLKEVAATAIKERDEALALAGGKPEIEKLKKEKLRKEAQAKKAEAEKILAELEQP